MRYLYHHPHISCWINHPSIFYWMFCASLANSQSLFKNLTVLCAIRHASCYFNELIRLLMPGILVLLQILSILLRSFYSISILFKGLLCVSPVMTYGSKTKTSFTVFIGFYLSKFSSRRTFQIPF